MTNKDLFRELGNIDDDLIKEAAHPLTSPSKKKMTWKKFLRGTQTAGTVAAVLAVVVLGYEVVSLNNKISSLQESVESVGNIDAPTVEDISSFVGIASDKKIGDMFKAASDYGEVYENLAEPSKGSGYLNGGGFIEDEASDGVREELGAGVVESVPSAPDTGEKGPSHSTTNVMTTGVDESDIVKTDGNYIYMVESGQISITDIRSGAPGEESIFIPSFKAPSDVIHEMYVDDGKMILITSHVKNNKSKVTKFHYYWGGLDEEVYCYTYDLKDPMNPSLIGSMKQDGTYYTSRKNQDNVYIFTNVAINRPDMKKNDAVKEKNLDEWIPMVNDKPVNSGCIYMGDDQQFGMLISSFDVDSPDTCIDSKYVMNGYAQVYVSADAIYFYQSQWASSRNITEISKMFYSDGILKAGESTSVNGYINDSFAISQQKDHLFVLATENDRSTEVNALHVFDSNLKQVGAINEIARGELIYAARYLGDYAYFITYKQMDPLFIADISDPSKPKIISELEVDGFSEYLHVWDENHILGIGYMTKDRMRTGIRYTMFDVSDPSSPKEENSLVIGKQVESEALYGRYKAILADPGKNLIGLSLADYSDKSNSYKYYYELLSYDSKKGFEVVKETPLKYDTSSGYRGLYSGASFYIAGNGSIDYFSLK